MCDAYGEMATRLYSDLVFVKMFLMNNAPDVTQFINSSKNQK